MKNTFRALLFFIGWVLSPMTWWNDAFVNIPLSYLMANSLFYILHMPFGWLMIGSYWFTNFIGLFFIYFSGKGLVVSSKNKFKTVIILAVLVIVYSAIMLYLDSQGHLRPLRDYFAEYYVK